MSDENPPVCFFSNCSNPLAPKERWISPVWPLCWQHYSMEEKPVDGVAYFIETRDVGSDKWRPSHGQNRYGNVRHIMDECREVPPEHIDTPGEIRITRWVRQDVIPDEGP